jgi:hypothetical protein
MGRPAYETLRLFTVVGPAPGKVRVIFTHDMIRTATRFGYTKEEAKSLYAFCALDRPGRPTIVLMLNASLADIVHECGHATFHLLEYAGIPVTYEDNEMYCYTLDFVFERVRLLQERARAKLFLKANGLSTNAIVSKL